MAFLDDDEFLVLKDESGNVRGDVTTFLDQHLPSGGSLTVPWIIFGTANHTSAASDIPVTQRFQYRDKEPHGTPKTIVRVRDYVSFINPHRVNLRNGTEERQAPHGSALLHHYKYKSVEEYRHKSCVRGSTFARQKDCNATTLPAGEVLDPSAWIFLKRHVPRYAHYENAPHLEESEEIAPAAKPSNRDKAGSNMASGLQVNSGDNPNKPYFVIHVGPHKTGTTSLQKALGEREKAGLLQEDGYTYMGRFLKGINKARKQTATWKALWDIECVKKTQYFLHPESKIQSTMSPPPCWKEFLVELESKRGQSVIVSDEDLSPRFYDNSSMLRDLMDVLQDHWNVRFVVAYRRLYEWILSAKQQIDRWEKWKASLNAWPQQGGKRILPFFPHVLKDPAVNASANGARGYYYRYTSDILEVLQQNMVPTYILNFHAPEGILTSFFCEALPSAPKACAWARAEPAKKTENVAQSLFYDIFAIEAAERGLVNTRIWTRPEVARQIKFYHENVRNQTAMDFILFCPTEMQTRAYLDASIVMEAQIMPALAASPEGEKSHRHDFLVADQAHKFCSINCDAELENEHWHAFFEQFASRSGSTIEE